MNEERVVYWGTPEPIQIQNEIFGKLNSRGHGSCLVRINESEIFKDELLKRFGESSEKEVTKLFWGHEIKKIVLCAVAKGLHSVKKSPFCLYERNSLLDFAEQVKIDIDEVLVEWGIKCLKFEVEEISFEEVDLDYDKKIIHWWPESYDTFNPKVLQDDVKTDQTKGKCLGENDDTVGIGMGIGIGSVASPMLSGMFMKSLRPILNSTNLISLDKEMTIEYGDEEFEEKLQNGGNDNEGM